MFPFGRSVRKFESAQSFRLFMEGVRALQHYDKKGASDTPVDEDELNKLLERAEKFFNNCVEAYPKDILPRYYHGIVLSIRAQVEQARALRLQIETGNAIQVTSDLADILFRKAATEFARVADQVGKGRGGRDLLVYAQYNEAQTLAKMGPLRK